MTSTHDLIASIPPYMVGIVSSHILGVHADPRALAEGLSDEARLKNILDALPERQRDLLMDLHVLGGHVAWDVLGRISGGSLDELRFDLEQLGNLGLVFQSGLTGRDPVILLPALTSFLEVLENQYHITTDQLAWKDPRKQSLWAHITMLNTIRTGKIRCKCGLEPFKKGWEFLEERLGNVLDVKRVFSELVELSCLKERSGVVVPLQRSAMSLALEGDSRYRLWRFFQLCKPYAGLDYQVFVTVGEKAIRTDFLSRSLVLWTVSRDESVEDAGAQVQTLMNLLMELGVFQEDVSGHWTRFSEAVIKALKTGRADAAMHAYSEEVIIQPTMEILVPKDFDTLDLLNIGEITDLVQADVVSIYRITRDSVFRALQDGWNTEKMLNLLDRISRHALPENVRMNIMGWSRSHPEAHIIKGTFLVLSDDKNLLPKGLDEILPGIFRIPERCEEEVSLFLEKKGVMVRGVDGLRESEGDIDWGKSLPLKAPVRSQQRAVQKEGVYPFGMIIPLSYGPRREVVFEEALHQGKSMIIFYPRQGYGEIQARKISPIFIFRRGGVPFMEAFCEDTGEGEVFDISKVRALFRQS
jgi:hypothetical protein